MILKIVLSCSLFYMFTASAESPRFNYIMHCQGCHLDDGRETAGIIPGLIGASQFLRVPGGREFLATVPGVVTAPISDGEIADVLNWMLYQFSGTDMPVNFIPYSANELHKLRKTPLLEVDDVREILLTEIAKLD
jgi:hypothetical protein